MSDALPGVRRCRTCRKVAAEDWKYCPWCRDHLPKRCRMCRKLMVGVPGMQRYCDRCFGLHERERLRARNTAKRDRM